ncbi:hypothetical protein LTR85_001900 [Meristemomyces frigidus]|nr:hypothetical protein LTR85_001900 [Meristemomyces frigidus]
MENSPFAKLAPELRNRIYELALTLPKRIVIVRRSFSPSTFRQEPANARYQPLALAMTCRVINEECQQLFYAANAFELRAALHSNGTTTLGGFCETIGGRNSAALRSVTVDAHEVYLVDPSHIALYSGRLETLVYGLLQDVGRHATCEVYLTFMFRSVLARDGTLEEFGVKLDMRSHKQSWDAFLEQMRKELAIRGVWSHQSQAIVVNELKRCVAAVDERIERYGLGGTLLGSRSDACIEGMPVMNGESWRKPSRRGGESRAGGLVDGAHLGKRR